MILERFIGRDYREEKRLCKYFGLPGERIDPGVIIFVCIQKLDPQKYLTLFFLDPSHPPDKTLVRPRAIQVVQAASYQQAVIPVDRELLLRPHPDTGPPGAHVLHYTFETNNIR